MLLLTLLIPLCEITTVSPPIETAPTAAVDWSQFIPEVIATFLGFGLALFGQWLWEHLKDKGNAKQIKKRIVTELNHIKSEINSISGINAEPFKLPIWDMCISAGDIKLLDGDTQSALSLVYSIIKEYNSWSLMQANYYFKNDRLNDMLSAELNRIKTMLLGKEKCSIEFSISQVQGGSLK